MCINKVNGIVLSDPEVWTKGSGIFLSGGPGGHCPPLNFDNPKGSKILYLTCGTIIRRVVAADRCKSSVIDFWIFFKYFLDVL